MKIILMNIPHDEVLDYRDEFSKRKLVGKKMSVFKITDEPPILARKDNNPVILETSEKISHRLALKMQADYPNSKIVGVVDVHQEMPYLDNRIRDPWPKEILLHHNTSREAVIRFITEHFDLAPV